MSSSLPVRLLVAGCLAGMAIGVALGLRTLYLNRYSLGEGWPLALLGAGAGLVIGAVLAAFTWLPFRHTSPFVGLRRPTPRLFATVLGATSVVLLALLVGGAWTPERGPSGADPRATREGVPVLLIGIDGLDPTALQRLMQQGLLPAFSRLVSDGTWGPLTTLTPAISPALWTTVMTGKAPAEHGIQQFTVRSLAGVGPLARFPRHTGMASLVKWAEPLGLAREVPISSRERLARTIGTILSSAGRRVAMLLWWPSWPAEPVDGVLVSERLAWDYGRELLPRLTYPPQLAERLRPLVIRPADVTEELLRPSIDAEATLGVGGRTETGPEDKIKTALAMDVSHLAIARRILETGASRRDLTAVYFRGVDLVSHGTAALSPVLEAAPPRSRFGPALAAAYERMDAAVAELVRLVPEPKLIVVCSDHGFSRRQDGIWDHVEDGPPGVLLLSGPLVERRGPLPPASLLDIAPTLLHLAGLPVARDMPGQVLTLLFAPGWHSTHPPAYVESYGDRPPVLPARPAADDASQMETLRSLGYIR